MELRQLNSFCQIVQSGTLKEAARRCFLTPSAVSQQIKTLEQELGLKLFELKGRKLALTPKGENFYLDAKKILDTVHEAGAKVKSRANVLSRTIALAAPACLRYFYLPSLARFRAAYPSIKLTILARSHADALSMVRSGDADLAMGLFPHAFVDLKEIPLITPKLTLVIPRQGVNFTAKQVGLKELAQQPMVLMQSFTTTRAIIDGAFRKKNLTLSYRDGSQHVHGSEALRCQCRRPGHRSRHLRRTRGQQQAAHRCLGKTDSASESAPHLQSRQDSQLCREKPHRVYSLHLALIAAEINGGGPGPQTNSLRTHLLLFVPFPPPSPGFLSQLRSKTPLTDSTFLHGFCLSRKHGPIERERRHSD